MKKIVYILSILFFTTSHAYNMEDFDFYTIACERNDYVSCSHLAIIYEEAKLVPQNMKKAEKLYAKACGGDYAFARVAILIHVFNLDVFIEILIHYIGIIKKQKSILKKPVKVIIV